MMWLAQGHTATLVAGELHQNPGLTLNIMLLALSLYDSHVLESTIFWKTKSEKDMLMNIYFG